MSKKKRYKHLDLGFNYRLTNLQAAVGVSQVKNLKNIIKKRNAQRIFYEENLIQLKLQIQLFSR